MLIFAHGQTVVISVTIAVAGVSTDPGALTFWLQSPSGAWTSYVYGTDPEVQRVDVGAFEMRFDSEGETTGIYSFEWQATAPAKGRSGRHKFILGDVVAP